MEKSRNDSKVKEDVKIMTESEKAITDLNDAIRSSHKDSKLIIADLKKIVKGDEKREALLERNCYPLELRDDGLTDSELRNLSRVLSVQENCVAFENNFNLILVAFNIIELGEQGLHQFIKKLDHCYNSWGEPILNVDSIRQIGIMICEVLFYPEVYKLAKKFLNLKSFVEIQKQILKILKNKLLHPPFCKLLNVIHMIASCGNRMKDAIPDEIEMLDLSWRKFNVTDIIALTNVMSHCTQLRSLFLVGCGITSSCLETFLTRLWKSELKSGGEGLGKTRSEIFQMVLILSHLFRLSHKK